MMEPMDFKSSFVRSRTDSESKPELNPKSSTASSAKVHFEGSNAMEVVDQMPFSRYQRNSPADETESEVQGNSRSFSAHAPHLMVYINSREDDQLTYMAIEGVPEECDNPDNLESSFEDGELDDVSLSAQDQSTTLQSYMGDSWVQASNIPQHQLLQLVPEKPRSPASSTGNCRECTHSLQVSGAREMEFEDTADFMNYDDLMKDDPEEIEEDLLLQNIAVQMDPSNADYNYSNSREREIDSVVVHAHQPYGFYSSTQGDANQVLGSYSSTQGDANQVFGSNGNTDKKSMTMQTDTYKDSSDGLLSDVRAEMQQLVLQSASEASSFKASKEPQHHEPALEQPQSQIASTGEFRKPLQMSSAARGAVIEMMANYIKRVIGRSHQLEGTSSKLRVHEAIHVILLNFAYGDRSKDLQRILVFCDKDGREISGESQYFKTLDKETMGHLWMKIKGNRVPSYDTFARATRVRREKSKGFFEYQDGVTRKKPKPRQQPQLKPKGKQGEKANKEPIGRRLIYRFGDKAMADMDRIKRALKLSVVS